jgi:hypothetical protein
MKKATLFSLMIMLMYFYSYTQSTQNKVTGQPEYAATKMLTPTTQAANITVTVLTDTSFTVNWVRGNGDSVIVFMTDNFSSTAVPVNSTTYHANSLFTSGDQLDSNGYYCIYKGIGSSIAITGLHHLTWYRIRVYEFFGGYGVEDYNTNTANGNPYDETTICYSHWLSKGNVPGNKRMGAVGLSIGNKGYFGIGDDSIPSAVANDFWEYDTLGGVWTQKADFPGTPTSKAFVFSIGSKGYVGSGSQDIYTCTKEFWEFDPAGNIWLRKADFPGHERTSAVGFSIGNKGYAGTGFSENPSIYFKDFWEYNPATDIWIQKADFGGEARGGAVGFSIGTKGYIGTGCSASSVYLKDFWQYDPASDAWSQKADFLGMGRQLAIAFAIGDKGFIGTGINNRNSYRYILRDFFEYNPSMDRWEAESYYGPLERFYAACFSFTTKAYIFSGVSSGDYYNDLWEYYDYPCPMEQAKDIVIGNVTDSTMQMSWTNSPDGNGTSVFVIDATTGCAHPADDNIYTGNSNFGSGTQIGTTGWYCIYDGTGTTCDINNLQSQHTYRIMLCSYRLFYGLRKYNTNSTHDNPVNQETLNPSTLWTKKASMGAASRIDAACFVIGSKAYIGTGIDGTLMYKNDFWEYDPSTNVWTQKANFAGFARCNAVGFSIGSMGYLGLGQDGSSSLFKDFWQYNPSTNSWTQKKQFGGNARIQAVGFSIGSKGYIGTGNTTSIGAVKDFWEYDPSTNIWLQKADFGGTARVGAIGFSIGTKGYIGSGAKSVSSPFSDLWEYDPATNLWTQKASHNTPARYFGVGFSIGNKGYIGTGITGDGYYTSDFQEYDPSTNTWSIKEPFSGTARENAIGFSLGTKGYIGTGRNYSCYFNDLWEYSDTAATAPANQASSLIITNVTDTSYTVSWTNGYKGSSAVFIKQGNTGNAQPVNYTTYLANVKFGLGTQIGTSGWYCVYNSSSASVTVSGLQPGTTYRIMVCAYNGNSGHEKYNVLTATNNPVNQTTDFTTDINTLDQDDQIQFQQNGNIISIVAEISVISQQTYIIITDVNGKTVLTQKLTKQKTEINTSEFSKGVYLLNIKMRDSLIVKKFFKD